MHCPQFFRTQPKTLSSTHARPPERPSERFAAGLLLHPHLTNATNLNPRRPKHTKLPDQVPPRPARRPAMPSQSPGTHNHIRCRSILHSSSTTSTSRCNPRPRAPALFSRQPRGASRTSPVHRRRGEVNEPSRAKTPVGSRGSFFAGRERASR